MENPRGRGGWGGGGGVQSQDLGKYVAKLEIPGVREGSDKKNWGRYEHSWNYATKTIIKYFECLAYPEYDEDV